MKKIFFNILFFIFLFNISVAQDVKVTLSKKVKQKKTYSKDFQRKGHPKDLQRIINRGKIIVALLNQEQVPFFFYNKDGILSGLDVELARSVADKLGVDLEFNRDATSFDELVNIVLKREADIVISKLSKTLERSKYVLYTEPYVILHHALMFNRLAIAKIAPDNPSLIKYIQNFTGALGVIQGSSYLTYAQNFFPKAKIIGYPNWTSLVSSLFKGDIVAVYRDELEIKKVTMQYPDSSLKVKTVLLVDTEDTIAMAVHHEDKQLLFWLNNFLKVMKHKYNVSYLLKQYIKK